MNPQSPIDPIVQGDKVDILPPCTSSDPIARVDAEPSAPESSSNEEETFPSQPKSAEKPITFTPPLQAELVPNAPEKSPAKSLFSVPAAESVDKKTEGPIPKEAIDGEAAPGATLGVTLNGQSLSLPLDNDQSSYYMMSLLGRAGVDPHHPQGQLVLECDGMPVGFMHPLRNGARVRIGWK